MAFPNKWKRSVDIGSTLRDEALSLAEKARIVADKLKTDPAFADETDDLLICLVEAGEDGDVQEFDCLLSQIYDIADAERIWVSGR